MSAGTAMRPGQRWMSDAEPELGLGTVVEADARSVVLTFTAADETRRYARATAPLRRVRFGPGDTIRADDGAALTVDAVEERDGILVYRCGGCELRETALSDRIALTGPRERLLAGRVDPPARFDLRLAVLAVLHRVRRSPVRGFVGPRVELLPHQFYIAGAVTGRHAPRVLLADETGLGKTIEACLILNRLLLTGRAARVLILVPDALVHQWLIELRRRFNLPFALFDAERCAAIDESDPGANPFLTEQLVLSGLDLLAGAAERTRQAAEAGWDVVVVDEAHHLAWTPTAPSPAYAAVAAVAARSEGLLLLTATPERLGEQGHFARLRLLDPDRYDDFARWQREAARYRAVADLGRRLLELDEGGPALQSTELAHLAAALGTTVAEITRRTADDGERRRVLDALIDRHGPGRVMFRNTRAALPRFPTRRVALHRLRPSERSAPSARGALELDDDPRLAFLLEILAAPEPAKLLVLCRSAAVAQALKAAVERRLRVGVALFHEAMTLVQRDRSAAWFVEPGGARVLIASEIGSEGRNFQHAQELVMFDLPLDPDLVEQRIGRLDRIGQRGTVHIHVPFVAGSGQEVLARWHDEGVGTFARPTLTALPLLEQFGARVRALAARADASPAGGDADAVGAALVTLIAETATAARALAASVAEGRDRLLELASLRRDVAATLIAGVAALDGDRALEDLFLRVLEHAHVYAEEIGDRVYLLNPDGVRGDELPALGPGEVAVTFDRETALVREDLVFLTADHPLVHDAMELLLASEAGNASFALAAADGRPHLRLEMVFVLEAVAPRRLHVDRFLPPTPIHVRTDQTLAELGRAVPAGDPLAAGHGPWIAEHRAALAPLLARMTAACGALAETRARALRTAATADACARLDDELARLRALAQVNDHVRPDELAALERERTALAEHITAARLRPDAARLVWHGPHHDGIPASR